LHVWLGSSLVLLSLNATILHIYNVLLLVLLTAIKYSGIEKNKTTAKALAF